MDQIPSITSSIIDQISFRQFKLQGRLSRRVGRDSDFDPLRYLQQHTKPSTSLRWMCCGLKSISYAA
ncbi:hypothetical protein CY34DRAFT_686913 [Suillus luteus UH-Slu-Lm8-n1]|uniref:Uncharacterized protein n=1 Tax=Suillus luteus UH-Slu-Lm8-n1 TaxID=930992 RepID=A0A0D0AHG4_9AGAM|nr:hypothetical protein CY34DRAFT_686913 [Suillus luteus UH-Slu-Lm8-n1]